VTFWARTSVSCAIAATWVRSDPRADLCRPAWPTFPGRRSCSSNCFMCRRSGTGCTLA
jgi:hypothetical protein